MNVTIVGSGLIGSSWAALFACGGHRVAAWDPSPAAGDKFMSRFQHARSQLLSLGARDTYEVMVTEDLDAALAGSEWVQENVPEDQDLKRQLYSRIEDATASTTILASSTSSFTWSQLAAHLRHPDRFLIAHPFHPPHLVPLVELSCPNPATIARAKQVYEAMRRVPVVLKREAVGHIGNRLASALWREAVNLVAEGIADVGDVDQVLIHGPGLRWSIVGTHLGYHLGGGDGGIDEYLRHLGPSQERRWASLGMPRLTGDVCRRIAEGVHAEAAGRAMPDLEAERDEHLLALLRLRRTMGTIDRPWEQERVETVENSKQQITELLEKYLEGLYTGNPELLRSVFHPDAALFGDVRGNPYQNTVDGWLQVVAGRPSPKALGEAFRMRTLGIEVMNDIAYAKAQCPMLDLNYYDYLSLLRQDGHWLITNKLFTHVPE